MRHRLAVLILAGAMMATGVWAGSSARSGYFESVHVSKETGDESGIQIQVNAGPSPTVDFALCEGACLELLRFPARIEGDRLTFTYAENGRSLARVEGRFVQKGLLLKVDWLESREDDNEPFSLIPRRKRQR